MARDKTSSAIGRVHNARVLRSFANYLTAMLAKMIDQSLSFHGAAAPDRTRIISRIGSMIFALGSVTDESG